MRIAMACDHGAYDEKLALMERLRQQGHEVLDCGGTREAMDYPDTAFPACEAVQNGRADCAVLLCGTGIGMSMAAGKVRGIRCARCTDPLSARLTREHNDANALALGARISGMEMIFEIVRVFLETPFSGNERHARRIGKIAEYEAGQA